MAIVFRLVEDNDFEQIAVLYGKYVDWQETQGEHLPPNPRYVAQEMKDIFHKKRKGHQENNYLLPPSERKKLPDHFGWVAEDGREILAYFEWGGKVFEGSCGCYIAVWKDGEEKTADELLAYTFEELKKIGFRLALGHMSPRMQENPKNEFMKRYAKRIVPEAENGDDLQFQRDL